MRITATSAGLFLYVVIFLAGSSSVYAESPQIILANSSNITSGQPGLEVVNEQLQLQNSASLKEEQKPVEHVIASGETLTSIANQHQTTWQRLYAKNVHISNPDVIDVGEKLVIPKAEEQLSDRAVPLEPAPAAAQPAPKSQGASRRPKAAAQPAAARGSAGGNRYTPGYCTWYAKNKRPDLPNNLGNASTWVARAGAQGLPTGSAPRAGAIGQKGNHVVYVESVNVDGSVSISEMNHVGVGVVSTRIVPANYFTYIY